MVITYNRVRVVGQGSWACVKLEKEVRKIEKLERTFQLHRVTLKKAVVYVVGKLSFEKFFPTSRKPAVGFPTSRYFQQHAYQYNL